MKRAVRTGSRGVIAVAAIALIASGCSSSDSSDAPSQSERGRYEFGAVGDQPKAGEPTDGGTLVFADYSEARSLDPSKTYATGDSGGNAMAAVYDVLVRYNPDSAEYEPWLAESLESNDDLTTWTLTLREGVEFTDGTPLDANAVMGSIGYYQQAQGADTALLAPNIANMEATDDRTVVFTMNSPWGSFPSMLAQAAGMIVAPAAYAGEEFTPIGAGPFTLTSYKPQEEMVLEANADYWKGAPSLDSVRFYWPLGDDALLAALNDDAADITYVRNPVTVDKALEEGVVGELTLSTAGNVVQINSREGSPGADVRVRQALAMALDPEIDYARSYEGKGLPGTELFPAESRWHSDVEPVTIDVDAATALLDEAKADGFDGTIRYMDGTDPVSRAESVATKALLERVGFTVEIEGVASIADQIQKLYVDHDFDVARGAMSVSEGDPYQRLQGNLHSESFGNALGYANPDMDAALDELKAAGTDEETQAALETIETIWAETVPAAIVGASATLTAWQPEVHGVVPTNERMVLLGEVWKD